MQTKISTATFLGFDFKSRLYYGLISNSHLNACGLRLKAAN